MKLWRSPSMQAGQLLRVVMSWAQYCVGTSTPVLHDVHTRWPHFEAKWLTSLRNYLRDIGGSIRIHQHGVCKLQRINDKFIMDVALSSGKFGPAALKRINYCRMYLNVLLLSDITLPHGKCLDAAAFEGDQDLLLSYHPGPSVNQHRPNDKAWAEWKRCLHLVCHRNAHHSLKEVLGPWTAPPQEYARHWAFLYSTVEDAIYHGTAFGYSVHRKLRHDYDKTTDEYTEDLPHDAVPQLR